MGLSGAELAPPTAVAAADFDGGTFEVAAALISLRPRLSVFPLIGPGGEPPPNWKRRRPACPAGIATWAARYPGAQMAVRTGSTTGLVVVEADDTDALALAESEWGLLPTATVRSFSKKGRPAVWMRLDAPLLTAFTRSVRIWSNGGYFPLPNAWIVRPDAADFQPLPTGWTSAALALTAPPTPRVRYFATGH